MRDATIENKHLIEVRKHKPGWKIENASIRFYCIDCGIEMKPMEFVER